MRFWDSSAVVPLIVAEAVSLFSRFTAIATYRKNRAILIEYFLEHELALEALSLEG